MKALPLFFLLVLTACTTQTGFAPVNNGLQQAQGIHGKYRVQRGDTVYKIAREFTLDPQRLAKTNHLKPPYVLRPGQFLYFSEAPPRRLKHQKSKQKGTIVQHKLSNKVRRVDKPRFATVKHWLWPTKGKLLAGFSKALNGNKGLNIVGKRGQPIRASAQGRVVYSGSGVRGYGNLLIIKHNQHYLSAYAHNERLLVKEGQFVKAGQKVALLGSSGAKRDMLHFEIRRNGKPMNPLLYLPRV